LPNSSCPVLYDAQRMTQVLMNYQANHALGQINQAEYGAHYIIIYPDLFTLRELYSNYIKKQIEENNEMILINPFYETTDSVRQILSEKGVNVSKYEREKVLVIIDSLKEYFGQQSNILFIKKLAKYAKQMRKNCLSVIGDLGAYTHKSKYNELIDYELSSPSKFDADMKGFCLYHQKDFDKFSDEQKQKLIEHHGKALKIERS
jgi:MEDS: MEthanogen/methylotroph, DcmR Sensory domain